MLLQQLSRVLVLAAILALASCGGGSPSGLEVFPAAPATPNTVVGLDRFLLFPNPLMQASGAYETNTLPYAQAYYAAVDPTNAKDTLAKWKVANQFDSGTGTQVSVVFGDVRDLGYGRRLTVRQNVDGTVAAYVDNYLVNAAAGYSYSSVNLDAAVAQASRYHIGTNAIEFSSGPAGGVRFTKFFTFTPSGTRSLTADMDGRGDKAMPGPCISCHGGRADPLTPPAAGGSPLFSLVQFAPSGARGDVQGRMHPLEVGHLDFASLPGTTRADQEAAMKTINTMVLCTYPRPAADPPVGEDACRRLAIGSEWQGTAAALIKAAYGGKGLPNATYVDTYVPATWAAAGQTSLYTDVVAPSCRACHSLRGTGLQSAIDFETLAGWNAYKDRIKVSVFDRGNMPLARLVYQRFHESPMSATLAAYLTTQGVTATTAAGAPLTPGRPIADPGPDRVLRQGAVTLSATMSLFATAYQWTLISGPAGATLTGATSAQPTFTSIADGAYVVQLTVSNGAVVSAPVLQRVVVDSALPLAPSAIRFSDIKRILQGATVPIVHCTSCHTTDGGVPVSFTNYDRNADLVIDAIDDLWFYTEVRGRINFTDIATSPLLRKPSGNSHSGGLLPGFDTAPGPGQPGRSAHYNTIVNWILNGAPQ